MWKICKNSYKAKKGQNQKELISKQCSIQIVKSQTFRLKGCNSFGNCCEVWVCLHLQESVYIIYWITYDSLQNKIK